MKRNLVKKKLREEEQQAIGEIYKQYIDTFQETSNIPRKTFIKSETLYAGEGSSTREKGQLYNPKPVIKIRKETKSSPPAGPSSSKRCRKKSNLKSLGDELKLLQHERQAKEVKLPIPKMEPPTLFCQENDYTTSTNLFVSNLSPNVTEDTLIKLFGTYGPLASVKIMWPRNEPTFKSANCGFVAFMSRSDAERALNGLKNYDNMKINWGKSVKIPTHPVHIPAELYKLYSPPPPSGLPFNAQIIGNSGSEFDLANAVVKVTIPFDRNLLMIIHRTIEFVVREGPEFEAMIMNIEIANPDYDFLRDFKNPSHTYYRWKLFSILNGDPKNSWSMKPFRMFQNGPIWIPPTAPNYKDGMPQELIKQKEKEESKLSESQASTFMSTLKKLTISRKSIANAMIFCVNNASAINDIFEILIDSLKNLDSNLLKKIARLYLLTDVLYNCKKEKVDIAKFLETSLEDCLLIFKQFNAIFLKLNYNQDRDCLRTRIFMILRSWVFHNFYDLKFITKLENIFLHGNEVGEEDDVSLNDEPLDGANLLKRSLQNATAECTIVEKQETAVVKKLENKTTKSSTLFDIFN